MKKCRRIYSKRKRDSSYLDNIDYNSANYLYGVEDGRKVKFIEMCDYNGTENYYGWDPPDYYYVPAHKKCWNKNQKIKH
ncbi:MAG TPA: hypothetical protein P5513_08675 [Candidatus Diapherotrites archaeon]|nr:hypothetical protein [Candidatus Diapherotrites archaeon]